MKSMRVHSLSSWDLQKNMPPDWVSKGAIFSNQLKSQTILHVGVEKHNQPEEDYQQKTNKKKPKCKFVFTMIFFHIYNKIYLPFLFVT